MDKNKPAQQTEKKSPQWIEEQLKKIAQNKKKWIKQKKENQTKK